MSLLIVQVLGFLLGLLLGSFLNVCIARVPAGESVVRPGSRCPACGHAVRWYDNVPVVSWLVLRGRCRDCRGSISWRYPAVELGFGLWCCVGSYFLYVFCYQALLTGHKDIVNGPEIPESLAGAFGFLALGFLLIGLMVMDWRTQRLPDAFTLTGIAIGFFLVCVRTVFLEPGEHQIILASKHLRLSSPGSFAARGNVFLTGTEALIYGRLLAIVGAALILLVVRWVYRAVRKRDGLGLGDVKLLAMVAAFLGFWPAVLTLFLGVLGAAVYGVGLVVRGRAGARTRVPLGSFLCAGGLFAALFGERVVGWYAGLFR